LLGIGVTEGQDQTGQRKNDPARRVLGSDHRIPPARFTGAVAPASCSKVPGSWLVQNFLKVESFERGSASSLHARAGSVTAR